MFTSVLVANRGEIAVRIVATLRRMRIRAVTVHTADDCAAVHVRVADESVLLPRRGAQSPYLDIETIVAAARDRGCEAIHPGYGFLSENAEFSRACEEADLVFIGPRPGTIRLMGDKREARRAVRALDVPVVPGFDDPFADDERLAVEIERIGTPVIVKPAAGGGGKGMHVVASLADATEALASARREAELAFGDGALLVERFVPQARHVEVQVVGDGDGGAIHLGDRDCSIQRRHQKVIEEAPAPNLPDDSRSAMRQQALAIARHVGYRGAGTVEFLVDARDPSQHYFLEMNTRLQVEHPVTEAVTGLDLVELQLLVAAGLPLPDQRDIRIAGHAVEARVYAEDGHRGFLPSTGEVLVCDIPDGIRVDSGIEVGSVVGTSFDPLLMKVVAAGSDRDAALDRLDHALSEITLLGVAHNIGLLRSLVTDSSIRSAVVTTSVVADWLSRGSASADVDGGESSLERDRRLVAALVLGVGASPVAPESPWYASPGWRVGDHRPTTVVVVSDDGQPATVEIRGERGSFRVSDRLGADLDISLDPDIGATHRVPVTIDGVTRALAIARRDGDVWIGEGGDAWRYRLQGQNVRAGGRRAAEHGSDLCSPMPGTVVGVVKGAGEVVGAGDTVVVVEAMKMEYAIRSGGDGTVAEIFVRVGDQVAVGQSVASIVSDPSERAT